MKLLSIQMLIDLTVGQSLKAPNKGIAFMTS